MALIDLDDLKTVLGVGDIYTDAELQACADAAEDTVNALLVYKRNLIAGAKYVDATNTATYWTAGAPVFSVGESVTISTYYGAPFEGTQTVTAVGVDYFTTDKNHNADHDYVRIIPLGTGTAASQIGMYDTVQAVRQAALAVAVDVFSTRLGTAGQTGVDFAPAPYRLGRSMYSRVAGLLGRYMDAGAFVG